jgi:hypothetical protein
MRSRPIAVSFLIMFSIMGYKLFETGTADPEMHLKLLVNPGTIRSTYLKQFLKVYSLCNHSQTPVAS